MKIVPARRTGKRASLSYQPLEPRQLLAATVYVDFGLGMSEDFSINDSESTALNGPAIFGAGFDINSFGAYNEPFRGPTQEILANTIIESLNTVFLPFDVSVQRYDAGDIADIQAALASTDTNDAYIFIGGTGPESFVDFGEAVIDSGNSVDNIAFVFDTGTPEDRDSGIGAAYYLRSNGAYYAKLIAKQAAHTFGLESVESGYAAFPDLINPGVQHDIMAQPGTNSSGEANQDASVDFGQSFFTQETFVETQVEGVSTGSQDSFDAMVAAVGRKADGPAYLTGFGGNDVVHLQSVGTDLVTVTIEGPDSTKVTSDIDVSDGLVLVLGTGSSELNLDAAVQSDVTITTGFFGRSTCSFAGCTDILPTTVLNVTNGAVTANIDSAYRADLQGSVFVDGVKELRTGDFDDTINFTGGLLSRTYTAGGNDTVNISNGTVGLIYTEDGDDSIVQTGGDIRVGFDAGAGNDVFDISGRDTGISLRSGIENSNGFSFFFESRFGYAYAGLESVIGSTAEEATSSFSTGSSRLNPDGSLDWTFVIDGATTIATSPDGRELTLENFSSYNSPISQYSAEFGLAAGGSDSYFVLNTAYELTIITPASLQISSELNPELGNTDGILHNITVKNEVDPEFGDVGIFFVYSNQAGSGDHYTLFNQTANRVVLAVSGKGNVIAEYVDQSIRSNSMTVHGSDSDTDIFVVRDSKMSFKLFGHGGDDLYFLGSTAVENSGDLGEIHGSNIFDGGEGVNRLHVNDAGNGDVPRNFSVTEDRIYNPDGNIFRGAWLNRSFGVVQVQGNQAENRFEVTPSETTRFVVDGNGPGGEGLVNEAPGETPADPLYVVEYEEMNRAFHHYRDNGGTWIFPDRKPIIHSNFEQLSHINFVATTTEEGAATVVRVYEGRNRRFVRELKPFGENYKGGANVAFADVNFDGVPDLVVAPQAKWRSMVRVFDVASGKVLEAFLAYGEKYRGGVNLAVGNVQGDSGPEIVTSQMQGNPLVRVFSKSDVDNYRLVSDHRPFHSSFTTGATIAVGDVNHDRYEDVFSGAGPGELPQIAIHDVSENDQTGSKVVELNRFLVFDRSFRGGLNLAAGNLIGNASTDLVIGAGRNLDPSVSTAGLLAVYQRERFLTNSPNTVLKSNFQFKAFENSRHGVEVTVRDFHEEENFGESGFQGKIDRVFVSNTKQTTRTNIYDLIDGSLVKTDQFFEDLAKYPTGVGIG